MLTTRMRSQRDFEKASATETFFKRYWKAWLLTLVPDESYAHHIIIDTDAIFWNFHI